MFYKSNRNSDANCNKKDTIPSIITRDINILGNIISDGNIDFDGTLNGNIHCKTLTIRANGNVKGELIADNIFVYGTINGLIRAKNAHLFSGCTVEGIIMHETISIEDGAVVDGKFKRTDRVQTNNEYNVADFSLDQESEMPILENIRLIR